MSQTVHLRAPSMNKCILQDGKRTLEFDIKSREPKTGAPNGIEKSISFETNEKKDKEMRVPLCSCCRPMDFPTAESKRLYEQAAKKGRRGVVLSLEIDQTTSYVTTLASEEHLKFRFQMPNSKQLR